MDRLSARGDLVTVALQGDFGKPRPALVVQSDLFAQTDSVAVLLVTSTIIEAPLLRILITPDAQNGLHKPSQIMVDKPMTVRRERLGPVFGRVTAEQMLEVSRALAVFLGIAR